jgi:phytoene dehydrogenase-like protein
MEKSIIIIGGGLTGLAAGCYGRMNGYKTSIFEMHKIAGGVCTAWKRKGYTIDGAMNWLVGTKPGSTFYKFWEELGATQDWKIYNHDRYSVYEDKDGKVFTNYCDADRYEEYLLKIAPEDKDVIQEYIQAIRTFSQFESPAEKPAELFDSSDMQKLSKFAPFMQLLQKWGAVSTQDFVNRFKNPYLRQILPFSLGGSVLWTIMALGYQNSKSAGYPIGGALALAGAIERRYRKLGGEIHFKSRVVKILAENNKAVGIKLADGTEHRADWIISAADGRTTIFDMLDGKYIDDRIKKMYDHPNLFVPLVYVGLGVNRSFEDVPASINGLSFPLEKPIIIAGKEQKGINLLVYKFDPTLSPEGKNVARVAYGTDYDYWEKLRQEPERYKAEKDRIADDVIAGLEQRFPGITAQVEMRDVATPMTWERYTGNWRGSYEGWMFSSESFTSSMSKTLPGLDNFYMAGQWVNPGGGMPTAAMSGNHTIQLICNKDNNKFVTSTR